LQPDTIIPNLAYPQNLNRFGYVLNNPINFNDPTGHKSECDSGPQTWAACKLQLKNFAIRTLKNPNINDLDALVAIVDRAADLYENYEDMIPAISGVLLGIEESNPFTVYNASQANSEEELCAAVGRFDCPKNQITGDYFTSTGFHPDYADGDNQLYHFWAYLATVANTEGRGPLKFVPGMYVTGWANNIHEIYQPAWPGSDGSGASWQDYALSQAGMMIGFQVSRGIVPPSQLATHIGSFLGVNGPGMWYVNPLNSRFPLEGSHR